MNEYKETCIVYTQGLYVSLPLKAPAEPLGCWRGARSTAGMVGPDLIATHLGRLGEEFSWEYGYNCCLYMVNLWLIYGYGWWYTYPSEKYESQLV